MSGDFQSALTVSGADRPDQAHGAVTSHPEVAAGEESPGATAARPGRGEWPDLSPWRQSFPAACEHETDPLRMRLDLHEELAILHEYGGPGRETSRVVSMEEVQYALAGNIDLRTGLLPPDTLWAVRNGGGLRVAIWRRPRVWKVKLRETFGGPVRHFALPMPGLVFICLPGPPAPYVYAAKARPASEDDLLYRMPAFNVFATGRVCTGSHVFPGDPARIPEEFFESYFSPDGQSQGRSAKHPHDLLALWGELDGRKTYPLDDLVAQFTVGDAMSAGITW
jgi:hypothetical protein